MAVLGWALHAWGIWLLANAWHGLKRFGRWWLAAGAAGLIGVPTSTVQEIIQKNEKESSVKKDFTGPF